MKKLFKVLELNEKDNLLTAFAKGGIEGCLKASAVILPVMGTLLVIGRCVGNKGELEKFEEESALAEEEIGA